MICPYCRSENRPGAVKCAACASWMTEAPPVREWVRPQEGRMLAGVCRGFADRFGLPPAAVRLAFLFTFFLGFMGALIYVACWIAMPSAPVSAPLATVSPPVQPPAAPGGGTAS